MDNEEISEEEDILRIEHQIYQAEETELSTKSIQHNKVEHVLFYKDNQTCQSSRLPPRIQYEGG